MNMEESTNGSLAAEFRHLVGTWVSCLCVVSGFLGLLTIERPFLARCHMEGAPCWGLQTLWLVASPHQHLGHFGFPSSSHDCSLHFLGCITHSKNILWACVYVNDLHLLPAWSPQSLTIDACSFLKDYGSRVLTVISPTLQVWSRTPRFTPQPLCSPSWRPRPQPLPPRQPDSATFSPGQ